jgi:hypothetical protein
MRKREIIKKKLRRFRKKKPSSIRAVGVTAPQFPSPPKGKPLIRIFKEKEYNGGTAVIEPVGGFTNVHITDGEQLKDFLITQLTKGHYVKMDIRKGHTGKNSKG